MAGGYNAKRSAVLDKYFDPETPSSGNSVLRTIKEHSQRDMFGRGARPAPVAASPAGATEPAPASPPGGPPGVAPEEEEGKDAPEEGKGAPEEGKDAPEVPVETEVEEYGDGTRRWGDLSDGAKDRVVQQYHQSSTLTKGL